MYLIKGYRTIRIPLLLSYGKNGEINNSELSDEKNMTYHYLYLKEHFDRTNKQNQGKILFVGNIDILLHLSYDDINNILKKLFSPFGEIDSVSISEQSNPSTAVAADDSSSNIGITRFAYIHFEKKSIVKYILSNVSDQEINAIIEKQVVPFITTCLRLPSIYDLPSEIERLECKGAGKSSAEDSDEEEENDSDDEDDDDDSDDVGAKRKRPSKSHRKVANDESMIARNSLANLRRNIRHIFQLDEVDIEEYRDELNEFMKAFNLQEENELIQRKEMRNMPDEDGFVTVVSR
jgi:hypothetical protein